MLGVGWFGWVIIKLVKVVVGRIDVIFAVISSVISSVILDFIFCYLLCQAAGLFIFSLHGQRKDEPKKKTAGCHTEATPSHLWAKTNKRPRFAHLNVFVS